MRATLESTSKVVTVDGVPARVWEGTTERGVTIVAFVTRVTPLDGDPTEFEEDLLKVAAPSEVVRFWPERLVL